MSDIKIFLAAIAKDEAPYISEWIFHHLRVGLSHIKIYVNNTTDKTEKILQKIKQVHNNVHYDVIDSEYNTKTIKHPYSDERFSKKNPLQSFAYNKAILDATKLGCDYILFLDIDEFFYTELENIKELIVYEKSFREFSSLKFEWILESGQSEDYSLPFKEEIKLTFQEKPLVKSLVETKHKDNIRILNSHHVISKGESRKVNNQNAFILHRWLRSQNEYLSALLRGDTFNNNNLKLKNNRNGWSDHYDDKMSLNKSFVENFKLDFNKFKENCGIKNLIQDAKITKLSNEKEINKIVEEHKKQHRDIQKILSGTKYSFKKFNHLENHEIDTLRDIAISLEKVNLEFSLAIMLIVKKLRPEGRLVEKKVKEYLNTLEKH